MLGHRAHVTQNGRNLQILPSLECGEKKKSLGEVRLNMNETPALPWQQEEMNSTCSWHLGC